MKVNGSGYAPGTTPSPLDACNPSKKEKEEEGAEWCRGTCTSEKCRGRRKMRIHKNLSGGCKRRVTKGGGREVQGGWNYHELFDVPGVGGGMPQTIPGTHSCILNPLQGGATGAEPLALARGSPLGTFSDIPTGRSLFLRLRWVYLRTGSLAGLSARYARRAGGGLPLSTFARDGGR